MSARPIASLVIASRNRCESLCRAIESALCQDVKPLDILIFDDASTDLTVEVIKLRYPAVRIVQIPEGRGYIALRNRGFKDAIGKYVVSIDDDAYFSAPDTVRVMVNYMEDHADCGAVATSFVEPGGDDCTSEIDELRTGTEVRSYIGTAHAIRRTAALDVGGYRETLVHQGEERDLCVRLRSAGYTVNFVRADPIVHCLSPIRDRERMLKYGTINTFLFDFWYVPLRYLPAVMAVHGVKLLINHFAVRRACRVCYYELAGLRACFRHRNLRCPLTPRAYLHYLALPMPNPIVMPKGQLPCPCRPK